MPRFEKISVPITVAASRHDDQFEEAGESQCEDCNSAAASDANSQGSPDCQGGKGRKTGQARPEGQNCSQHLERKKRP